MHTYAALPMFSYTGSVFGGEQIYLDESSATFRQRIHFDEQAMSAIPMQVEEGDQFRKTYEAGDSLANALMSQLNLSIQGIITFQP